MPVLEAPDYQAARDRIKGNPIIIMMAAGVATVPLAEIAHEDGTPRFEFMQRANRVFDEAEARNAGNPGYQPYPAGAPRHLGLIAEAVLAERAAIRAAVALRHGRARHRPESSDVTLIIERLRAGESAWRSPARREPPVNGNAWKDPLMPPCARAAPCASRGNCPSATWWATR